MATTRRRRAATRTQTESWKAFERNIVRTRAFPKMFFAGSTKPTANTRRGQGKPSNEENELLRAAITFGIGALDAYLSEVAAEVLVAQLEAATDPPSPEARSLLKRACKEIDTLALELALTSDVARRRAVVRQALVEHLTSNVSNHGAKAVATTLTRMGEGDPGKLWNAVHAQASKWPALTTSGRQPAAILDHWTTQRHKIVHEGQAVRVTGDQARQLTDFVESLGREIDKVALETSRTA